jgi:hypothetical protein
MSRPGNYIVGISTIDYSQRVPYGNKGIWSLKDQQLSVSKSEWVTNIPRTDAYSSFLVAALPLNFYEGFKDKSVDIRGGVGAASTVVRYDESGGGLNIFPDKSAFPTIYGSSARKPHTNPYGTTFIESHIDVYTGAANQIGTGDFCLEFWFYTDDFTFATNNAAGVHFPFYKNNPSAPNAAEGYLPLIKITGDYWGSGYRGIWYGYPNESLLMQTGTVLTTSTWYHVAITRSGATNRIFINGGLYASASDSTNWTGHTWWFFDSIRTWGAEFRIQDLRIYKGTPKYTSAFTPPGSMFL